MSSKDPSRPGESLADLVAIMARLLAPDGCPWDREQTHDSLRKHLLESGASLLGQEFEAAPESCGLLEVGPDAADQAEPAAHVFELCRIRDRALPAIGGDEVAIHASRDGGLVLLTWRAQSALWFRLLDGTTWSEPRSIEADANVELLWKSVGR